MPAAKPSYPALMWCIRKKMTSGSSRGEAEASCRGEEPESQFGAPPEDRTDTSEAMRMSAAGGLGWNARTGNLGTGAVVKPDPAQLAKSWADEIVIFRPLMPDDKDNWAEYAKRMGCDQECIDKGWGWLMQHPTPPSDTPAKESLDSVFGEATSWWGYSVPNLMMLKMPQAGPVSRGEDSSGFPFATKAAMRCWSLAQKLIPLYPLARPEEIMNKAIEKAGTLATELTPEDEHMLKLAIDWAQNGPARTDVRIGGLPGGPARSGTGQVRGAP